MKNSFVDFVELMHESVIGKAHSKGYMEEGEEQPGGQLLAFVDANFGGHALGEVVYKAVRYSKRHDPEDLVKIASWAYLHWARHHYHSGNEERRFRIERDPVPAVENIRKVLRLVEDEAVTSYTARPKVRGADMVRLAALVAEEAGEAVKAALDATRHMGPVTGLHPSTAEGMRARDEFVRELIHTASMAVVARVVIDGQIEDRRKGVL